MSRIEKRVLIDDATERVFSYLAEPIKSPEEWPGLLEVREVHHLIGDIHYASWLYKITGLFETLDIRLEYAADQDASILKRHGLDLAILLDFEPDSVSGPRLALDGDYTYWSTC